MNSLGRLAKLNCSIQNNETGQFFVNENWFGFVKGWDYLGRFVKQVRFSDIKNVWELLKVRKAKLFL